jgi:hypothetical protein
MALAFAVAGGPGAFISDVDLLGLRANRSLDSPGSSRTHPTSRCQRMRCPRYGPEQGLHRGPLPDGLGPMPSPRLCAEVVCVRVSSPSTWCRPTSMSRPMNPRMSARRKVRTCDVGRHTRKKPNIAASVPRRRPDATSCRRRSMCLQAVQACAAWELGRSQSGIPHTRRAIRAPQSTRFLSRDTQLSERFGIRLCPGYTQLSPQERRWRNGRRASFRS